MNRCRIVITVLPRFDENSGDVVLESVLADLLEAHADATAARQPAREVRRRHTL